MVPHLTRAADSDRIELPAGRFLLTKPMRTLTNIEKSRYTLPAAAVTAIVMVATLCSSPAVTARPIVGVGDNGPAMFADRNFQSLGTTISRKIIPYDFHRSAFELDQLRSWIDGATALGIEPLIAFEHSHTNPRKLPSAGEYRKSVVYLRTHFPVVRSISAWNEANHVSQPTWKNPGRAAKYFRVARQVCGSCRIVAADVLDQANMLPWLRTFKRKAGGGTRIWGLHSYGDSNKQIAWADSSARKLLRAVKGDVWLTEVGGIVAFKGHFRYDEIRAAAAVGKTLKSAGRSNRIKRVYLYSWFGTDQSRRRRSFAWDSGLVSAAGEPRAGFRVLKNWCAADRC